MHQNVQGVLNKIENIEFICLEKHVDIIALSEHWLTKDSLVYFNIKGYKNASFYCRENKRRGGTGILVKESIIYKNRNDICKFSVSSDFECSAVELDIINNKKKKNNIVIVSCYRTPNSDCQVFFLKLQLICDLLAKEGKYVLFLGDFNLNTLEENKDNREFRNILRSYNLKMFIGTPTRVTNNSSSCLDNIIGNVPQQLVTPQNIFTGLSDHNYTQFLDFNIDKLCNPYTTNVVRKQRIFSNENFKILEMFLEKESWDDLVSHNSVDDNFLNFVNTFKYYYDLAFPLVTSRLMNKTSPWVTSGIRRSAIRLKELFHMAKTFNTESGWNKYKKYRSVYRRVLVAAKKEKNLKYISNSNNISKASWDVIKNETQGMTKNYKNITLKIDAEIINEPSQVAEEFNKYFCSVPNIIEKELNKLNPIPNVIHPSCTESILNSFIMQSTTEKEIIDTVKKFDSKKASGLDEISPKVFIRVIHLLATPLTLLVNSSFGRGAFPSCLKVARVRPLFKKDDTRLPANYRPVSILSVISKVIETLVKNRLTSFLMKYNVLHKNQYGFQRNLSTIDALVNFSDAVHLALDKKQAICGLFCDLQKAFDCVDHNICLNKLDKCGIRGLALNWFASFLQGRTQVVEVDNFLNGVLTKIRSSPQKLLAGVPQGSTLGPLIFLLYINDLPYQTSPLYNFILFADDTTVLIETQSVIDLPRHVSNSLNYIFNWLKSNKLSLNSSKTQIMNFHYIQKSFDQIEINFQNNQLNSISKTNFLGLVLDENMRWESHINKLAAKLSSACYAIRRIKEVTNSKTAHLVYYGYFDSVMRYGILCWGSSPHTKVVFKIQKRAVRILANLKSNESCKPYFSKFNILTIYSIYVLESLCFLFRKLDKKPFDPDLAHNYDTRKRHYLPIPPHRTTQFKNSNLYMCQHLFNKLPESWKKIKSFNKFKSQLKKYLLNTVLYSIEEFRPRENYQE